MRFRHRRIRNITLTLVLIACLRLLLVRLDQQLGHAGYWSGYVLGGSLLLLAAYNLRKRVPFLPLGTSAFWLQTHIYLALATLPLFAWHVQWRIPNGWLEGCLSTVFGLTWCSGLYGLYITRRLPRQLTQMGHEYLAEEIPWHTAQVRTQALELARTAHRASPRSVLPSFYLQRLFAYFERPRSLLYVAYPTSVRRRRLQHALRDLDRYLSVAEVRWRDRLMELVQKKDDLDFHAATQAALRLWFFAHIGLTMLLIVLGTMHGILAMAFRGGY